MNIHQVVNLFAVSSPVEDFYPFGNGHINTTFFVTTQDGKKYVLQKINNTVFKDTNLLMNNIFLTTEYLRGLGFESLHVIRTRDGKLYLQHEDSFYRLYDYIENTICHEKIDNLSLVYSSAKAFGKLHRALADFDASELGEVIPDFHNTHQRYLNLLDAIDTDEHDRVKTCLPEIKAVKKFKKEYRKVTEGIEKGEIAYAVTHNDPKINNVLFDRSSGQIKAVVDLDTIMPGSYLFDFGDALRSLFTGDNEDSEDLSKLVVNLEVFETYTKGYLSEMEEVLTPKEVELLPFSAFLLSIECGIRFLEDYIRGDVYFKTDYPTHNLVRARTQITLAQNIYKELDTLKKIVNKVRKALVKS